MDTRLQWYGPEVTSAVATAAVKGLNASAVEVQKRSRAKVPVRTRALHDSLQVAESTMDHLESIVFSDSSYAVYQHELFSYKRGSGQPKFLEAAAREFRREFQQIMTQHLRSGL